LLLLVLLVEVLWLPKEEQEMKKERKESDQEEVIEPGRFLAYTGMPWTVVTRNPISVSRKCESAASASMTK
jgi:hypothetical protein